MSIGPTVSSTVFERQDDAPADGGSGWPFRFPVHGRPPAPRVRPSDQTQVQAIVRPETSSMVPTLDPSAEDAEADAAEVPLEPDEAEAPAVAAPAAPARITVELGDLASVMSQIEVRPLDDGRVALELPRPAAVALGGLLRALAAAVEGTPAVQ